MLCVIATSVWTTVVKGHGAQETPGMMERRSTSRFSTQSMCRVCSILAVSSMSWISCNGKGFGRSCFGCCAEGLLPAHKLTVRSYCTGRGDSEKALLSVCLAPMPLQQNMHARIASDDENAGEDSGPDACIWGHVVVVAGHQRLGQSCCEPGGACEVPVPSRYSCSPLRTYGFSDLKLETARLSSDG